MDTIMALSVGTPSNTGGDFDELYGRYAGRLLAAAAEQIAAIAPAAADLDEDLAEQVWDAVEAGHYPEGRRGLEGLLVLLRDKVRRVRARAAAASDAIREAVIDLDDIADEPVSVIGTLRPLPATVSAAVATLRALPLAG
ncbi:hypothetical protein OG689_44275 [Kitasatospora sp. NBC_00240]|uniref:hypothetical protein n=1 Tax=Kitasatospora sp. NBC_00240 TaxID=2903567 RepID=UPI002254FA35|nr:hypothetical protein [Kitasatospora sp. NBC_00240]MCX5216155.1 hypothetical protein [Kitasatospora sp. NBC_00240]